jgi:hypothetical protein
VSQNLPYIITPKGATVVIGTRTRVVACTSANFGKLVDALRTPVHDVDLIADLADISLFVARATFGAVQIAEGQVRWNGEKVHNVVADRLIQLLKGGHELQSLANFLDRLMKNPLQSARDELYLWLESGNSPITPDGFFLAFKKVRNDYKDCYTGTVDNSVGQKPSMPRERVDTDRHNTCSVGLHFCSYGYLGSYSGDRVMLVKVDPADVVAIPADYNNQKGRTWTYEVIGEVEQDRAENFYAGSPVVQPHDEVTVSEDEVEVPHFREDDEVVFIGSEDTAEHFDLTVGNTYTLIGGTDSDGEVFPYNDSDEDRYVSAEWFKPAGAVEPLVTNGGTLMVPGTEFANTIVREDEGAVEEETPTQAPAKPVLQFTHVSGRKQKTFLASEVIALLEEHGQRGMERHTGVPRTTIQGWVKAINAQGEGA